MATGIDSLEIKIESNVKSASDRIDEINKRLGLLAEGMTAIGKNSGLEEFAQKAQEITKNLGSFPNAAKGISASMEPQIQKAAKSLEELTAKFKDLGKAFVFKGSTDEIKKQIDKYTNSLETAKLKKEELEATGKTEGKAYEAAVAKTIEYTNVIESLKQQLAEVQTAQPQLNINISGLEEAEKAASSFSETLREAVQLPAEAFNYNPDAMAATFGEAARSIENYQQAVEQLGTRAGQILNDSTRLNINISGLEEAEQNINGLSGQLQNMKNLFLQTFADLKSGDIFRYLSESAQDFVKRAQLAAGVKVYTEDYKTLQGDIECSEKALEKLEQKKRDMEAEGTSTESAEWQKLTSQIATAESRLDSYIAKRNEMQASGADVEFTGGLANQSAIKNMGAVASEAMAALRQKLGEIPSAVGQVVGNIPIIGRVAKESAFLGQSAFNGLKTALSGIPKVASVAVGALSKITSVLSKLASGVKGAVSKLGNMSKVFKGLNGASMGMNTSLGGGLKNILRYGLGIRSLYTLLNKLRTAMKDGFKNLAQYSGETNDSISMLQSSLGALKNSLATAFAPILNVIAPALSAFIDMLTKAFNTVGQFFSALTGKSLAVQAQKTFTDYADSVSEAGSATKKAGKDVKTGTRAFDELKTITKNEQGDSGGADGGEEVSPADMFETIPIESNVSDFAQKIKDAWASTDFTEIGAILGGKLKNALDGINWEGIKEAAEKIGKSIATLINGFVEVDGLADSIGRTIGETINTAFVGINTFLDNTHWDSIGKFLGEGLNSIVNTVDFGGIGHLLAAKWNAIFETLGNFAITFDWVNFGASLAESFNTRIADFNWAENGAHLGELIKGLLDTLIAFLEETDWQALGNGIADFIGGIDWTGIFERLAEGIGAALGGLAALLWGLIQDGWNSVVQWWQDTAFEDGQFTITGLLNGIWEGIKGIGVWIDEHIFKPFVDGFKKAFGIHSPSKVMEEQGVFLMQGLFGGISSLVDKVVGAFTKIKDKIIGIWNTLKTKTLEIWNGISNAIKVPVNGIIGFVNSMLNGMGSGLNGMINALNKLSFDVPDWVPLIGGATFGFNIPNIIMPQIPLLANGAVLKGGNPFLAILNDQQRGQTNIEAPLDVIKEALREELRDFAINVAPETAMNYQFAPAPAPSFSDVYGNYQYDVSAYTSRGNNDSEMASMIEQAVYRATYNAVSSAIGNNKVISDIRDITEDILKKPTIGESDIGEMAIRHIQSEERRLQAPLVGLY